MLFIIGLISVIGLIIGVLLMIFAKSNVKSFVGFLLLIISMIIAMVVYMFGPPEQWNIRGKCKIENNETFVDGKCKKYIRIENNG